MYAHKFEEAKQRKVEVEHRRQLQKGTVVLEKNKRNKKENPFPQENAFKDITLELRVVIFSFRDILRFFASLKSKIETWSRKQYDEHI